LAVIQKYVGKGAWHLVEPCDTARAAWAALAGAYDREEEKEDRIEAAETKLMGIRHDNSRNVTETITEVTTVIPPDHSNPYRSWIE
jgi:hypothetical protein